MGVSKKKFNFKSMGLSTFLVLIAFNYNNCTTKLNRNYSRFKVEKVRTIDKQKENYSIVLNKGKWHFHVTVKELDGEYISISKPNFKFTGERPHIDYIEFSLNDSTQENQRKEILINKPIRSDLFIKDGELVLKKDKESGLDKLNIAFHFKEKL